MVAFTMRCSRASLLIVVMTLGFCVSALAQGAKYGLGRTPTPQEVSAIDTAVGPEGKELPPGSGTAQQGATVYTLRGCARCHGPTGAEGPGPHLAGVEVAPTQSLALYPPKYWPFATMIFSHIYRNMPLDRPGYLSADEGYALTALVLFRNGIIEETDVMDAKSLPKVQMPFRNRYVLPPAGWKPGTPRPFVVE